MAQLAFEQFNDLGTKRFGGLHLKGNPRTARPISLKKPVHLVLRSEFAKGEKSFLRKRFAYRIEASARRLARLTNLRIFRFVNAGDHLQLIVQIRSRKAFHKFVRALSGHVARIVLDAEKGRARGKKFWIARPYTQILKWNTAFSRAAQWLRQQVEEVIGFTSFTQETSSA